MKMKSDITMERTIVQFEAEQLAALRALARERGVSVAALVREAVDALLSARSKDEAWERAMRAAGRFRSGKGDVGREHDRYLTEGSRW